MSDFLTALALVLVIEGLLYAAAPTAMRDIALRMTALPPSLLRRYGLVAAALGVALVALIRG